MRLHPRFSPWDHGQKDACYGLAMTPARATFYGLLLLVAIVTACGAQGQPPTVPPPAPPTEVREAARDAGLDVALSAPLSVSVSSTADASATLLQHRGVNLSGGEFGACCPGRIGQDYAYPSRQDIDLMAARRMTHIRLPFRHERLQRALQTGLDAVEWSRINEVLTYALSKGMSVALEPHNSARYNGIILTEVQMGDFWGRVVQRLPADGRVWPDLTNEPHDMPTEQWLALAKAAVREIRRVGFTGRILVPGNGWDGAASWASNWYGTPNASLMQQITDPGVVFEAHLYLDGDASGGGSECVSETIGVERLRPFTSWLKTHRRAGYLGELGAPNTPTCARAIAGLLTAIEAEPTLWIGWAWWSAGSRWPLNYQLSVQPIPFDAGAGVQHLGADRPQMEWLRPFLYCGGH